MSLRDEKLILGARKAAKHEREAGLWLPEGTRTYRTWPLCMLCGREVEAAEIKNVTNRSVEIWGRCHGGEDWTTIQFDYAIDNEGDVLANELANTNIQMALKSITLFDPTRILR